MRPSIPLAALALLLPIAAHGQTADDHLSNPTAPGHKVENGVESWVAKDGFNCAYKIGSEFGPSCSRTGRGITQGFINTVPGLSPGACFGMKDDGQPGNVACGPANPLIGTLPQTDMPLADVIKAAKDGRVVVMQDGLKIRPRVVDGVPEACAVSEDASQMVLRVLKQTTSEIGDASVGTLLAILRIQRSLLPPGCPLP